MRSGTREYAPNAVTVTAATPTPPAAGSNFDITLTTPLAVTQSVVYVGSYFSYTGDTIPAAAMAGGQVGWISSVGFGTIGFTLNISSSSSNDDFTPAVESGARLDLSVPGQSLSITGFTDTTAPYTILNPAGYSAFYNALSDGATLTLRLRYP